MLKQDSIRNIETISSGTLLGIVVVLLAIDYLPRVVLFCTMIKGIRNTFVLQDNLPTLRMGF